VWTRGDGRSSFGVNEFEEHSVFVSVAYDSPEECSDVRETMNAFGKHKHPDTPRTTVPTLSTRLAHSHRYNERTR
jgi:hypothetical protein